MPRLARFLLDESPVSREALDEMHANDPAFRDLCGQYEDVAERLDEIANAERDSAEAARLESRRDALRGELLALVDRIHH